MANPDLNAPRERDVDLYDFSPVGHLTLTQEGLISAINLAAATQLGVAREQLLQCPFSQFVTALDNDRWHQSFVG